MNGGGVNFAMHTGDIKSGSTLCDDLYYTRYQDLTNSLNVPSLMTLGDNEWTDCHRANNGNYNPLERLRVLRTRFFGTDGRSILGQGPPIRLNSYGVNPYIENQFFQYNGVTFTLLHVPGTNNNLYDGSPFALCPSTLSSVYDPNCTAATAEYQARDAAANLSLRYLFSVAKLNRSPGIMIVIQADFVFVDTPTCNAFNITTSNVATKVPTGFVNFLTTLMTETANYSGRVVLVHGDSHFYRRCNPFGGLSNIETLMVPGSNNFGWVKATINANTSNVFSFERYAACSAAYSIYNAATDAFFGPLLPGATVTNPPCSINIFSNVTCQDGFTTSSVLLRLRSGGNLVQTRLERLAPFFLFGDAGTNILAGSISPGSYTIETTAPGGIFQAPMSFTMGVCV
jgi:hypothetical protein